MAAEINQVTDGGNLLSVRRSGPVIPIKTRLKALQSKLPEKTTNFQIPKIPLREVKIPKV